MIILVGTKWRQLLWLTACLSSFCEWWCLGESAVLAQRVQAFEHYINSVADSHRTGQGPRDLP
jgi:hypothetical protein